MSTRYHVYRIHITINSLTQSYNRKQERSDTKEVPLFFTHHNKNECESTTLID